MVLTTIFSHLILDLPWTIAAMFGSISAVSGPTVISPLLRAVNPSARLGHILRWECILVDPIGALLAILVFTL